jgi:tetratricopeptide (TPR) repeat protein/arylsulfatase A-like enzyme
LKFMQTEDRSRKVLLIGWDAADWKVIMPLIDAGKMPNLARLIEQGICANIATLQPVLSPMLWTSIATGKRAYKHGIHGFSEPDPVTGGIRPVTNLSRKTKAVWNILNQSGLSTIVIGWWPSNPVEELSKGVMVSNDYQRAVGRDPKKWPLKVGTIHPARLQKSMAELRFHPTELTEADLCAFLPGLEGMSRADLDKAEKDARMQALLKIIADCTSIHSAATALIETEPWDFMAVYYDAIDHFGHAFMRYHPPKQHYIDDWDFRVFNYCLEGGYLYHDMMLGTLLRLGGENTTVILMSDHGFHPDHLRPLGIPREPAGPAVEHRQFGIFVAKGPDIKKDERIYGANLLDVCPTLLHLFGLPVGEDMDGKVLLDIYKRRPAAIERIPTWDEVEGDHGMHPPGKQISPADSKAAIQQLVALGYIAEPNTDRATALEETVRELEYNLAQSYMDGGIHNRGADILERLYLKWPMEHRFGFKLAACYQNLGRTADLRGLVTTLIERRVEEASTAAATLKSLNLDDPTVQKAEKERIEKMNDREKQKFGRERRELIAKARPNFFSLRYLEACADFAEKRYEVALRDLEQLDHDYGARRNALVLRGEICQRLRQWEQSRVAFEQALEIDPESPGPLLGLARSALAARDYESAARYARESIGLVFFQPRAHYIHGLAQYRLARWEEAEHAFLLCIRQAPLFSAGYRMLGEVARWYKKDSGEQATFQVKALQTRRQLRELRNQKMEEAARDFTAFICSRDTQSIPELKPNPAALAGIPASEIVTVVSGLPRSGTSLMMQILKAAGIPPFTDKERKPDESNEKGYYEHAKVANLLRNSDKSWVSEAKGKAIKVVVPLLVSLPRTLKTSETEMEPVHYRILFMEREIEEILHSQTTMLSRLGKSPARGERVGDISKAYRQQEIHAKAWCVRRGIHAMSISYAALVHRPNGVLPQISDFLGGVGENLSAMCACINPALHRARKMPGGQDAEP